MDAPGMREVADDNNGNCVDGQTSKPSSVSIHFHSEEGQSKEDQPYIRKLCDDYTATFGDGGWADLHFPVYICDGLPIGEHLRTHLCRHLRAVDAIRMDVQPNGIVHDIVDPSLHSRLLTKEEQYKAVRELDKWNHEIADLRDQSLYCSEDYDDEDSNEEYSNEEYSNDEDNLKKASELDELKQVDDKRGRFQWVPAIVQCHPTNDHEAITDDDNADNDDGNMKTKKWTAHFQGPIAGAPDRNISPMFYQDMERILSDMLPMFERLGIVSSDDEGGQELQVVAKVQEYVLPPRSKYTGRWHTEGYTEQIKAAGVFYLDVSSDTSGGDLLFRPPRSPDSMYQEDATYRIDGKRLDYMPEEFDGKFTTKEDVVYPDEKITIAGVETSPETNLLLKDIYEGKKDRSELAAKGIDISAMDEEELMDILREAYCYDKVLSDRSLRNILDCFQRFTKAVPIRTGTAVAFKNSIPHRFSTIRNETDTTQRRLFVNFFIVDPDKLLPCTTSNAASPGLVSTVLDRCGGVTDRGLHRLVMDFCGGYSRSDLLHRRVVRDQARAAMSSGRQRWRTQHYGNAGFLEFFDQYDRPIQGFRNYEHSGIGSSILGSGL